MREMLPDRRRNETTEIEFAGEKYIITVGFYNNNKIGEVFINRVKDKVASKLGTALDGACRDSAILMSMALQFGTPLQTIAGAITRDEDGTPDTIIGAVCDKLTQRSSE